MRAVGSFNEHPLSWSDVELFGTNHLSAFTEKRQPYPQGKLTSLNGSMYTAFRIDITEIRIAGFS